MNERTKRLQALLKTLTEQEGVFICGPSDKKTHLRVYAYGGKLLEIPVEADDCIIPFDIEYLKYVKDNPAHLAAVLSVLKTVDDRICAPVFTERPSERPGSMEMITVLTLLDHQGKALKGPRGGKFKVSKVSKEREEAFCAAVLQNLPALLEATHSRFAVNGSDADKERALQTVSARSHRSFAENGGVHF